MSGAYASKLDYLLDNLSVTLFREEHSKALLENITSHLPEGGVDNFLRATRLYDHRQKRWAGIPDIPNPNFDLVSPIANIVDAVLSYTRFSDKRTLLRTHETRLNHIIRPEDLGICASPDLVVSGMVGSNFRPNAPLSPVLGDPGDKANAFAGAISFIWVKARASQSSASDLSERLIAARQCQRFQSNRTFVWTMVINEYQASIQMFDRTGPFATTSINYHLNPATFVQMILAISLLEPDFVGIDTSISYACWRQGDVRRYIKTLGPSSSPVHFPIITKRWSFEDDWLQSSGATLWQVDGTPIDRADQMLFVLEAWLPLGKLGKEKFSEIGAGFAPVAQAISYEERERRMTTNRHRRLPQVPNPDHVPKSRFQTRKGSSDYTNRTWTRVLFQLGHPGPENQKLFLERLESVLTSLSVSKNLL